MSIGVWGPEHPSSTSLSKMARVPVPEPFVEFMQHVVEMIDSDQEDDRALADIDDGLQCEHGYGGRDGDTFSFEYFPDDREERWSVKLSEVAVRDVADGHRAEMEVAIASYPRPKRRARAAAPTVEKPRMVDDLVARGLVALRPRTRPEYVERALERAAFDAFDDPSIDDHERGERILDALVDLSGVEEVFANEEEIVRVLRPYAKD
jgi:hypothetical protein